MKLLALALVVTFTISCSGDSFYNEILQRRNAVEPGKCKPIDLAIILDSSNSISSRDWETVQRFAKSLVDSLGDVSKDGSHVALIRFSREAVVDLNFNSFKSDTFNAQSVKAKIDKLNHMQKSTFLDKALELADKEIFTIKAGMRENKKIKKVIVIMTDGMQTINLEPYTPLKEASEPLIHKNVNIYSLGVGPAISLQQLVDMASLPSNVYSVPGFDSLLDEVRKMRLITCDCYEPLDIGIILDGSTSVDQFSTGSPNFDSAKRDIINLLKQLHLGPGDDQSHFGMVVFSDKDKQNVEYSISDDPQTIADAEKKISRINWSRDYTGDTYISEALVLAGNSFFKDGTKGNRKKYKDIAIVFTDGVSNSKVEPGLDSENMKGIPVIAVGIGKDATETSLKEVARGVEENVVMATSFKDLSNKLDEIANKACKASRAQP